MAFRRNVVVMLSCFSLVGYMLRMNISIAAKLMMTDLALDKIEMGEIFSAFMVGYALFQIPWGVMGDRMGPRRVLTIAALICGATTLLTGVVPGILVPTGVLAFAVLLLLRFLLGAGEAAVFPLAARAVASWLAPAKRGLSYSLVIFGSSAGCAFTAPVVSWLMVKLGWRGSFYVGAGIAVLLAFAWSFFSKESEQVPFGKAAAVNAESIASRGSGNHSSWFNLARDPNVALISISYFLDSYVLFVFVFWLYLYLVEKRGFSILTGGLYTGAPFVAAMFIGPLAGYLCDYLSEHSGRRLGRRVVAMGGLSLSAIFLWFGIQAEDPYRAIVWLSLSVGFLLSTESAFWSSSIDLGGANAGAAGGVLNTAGNLGGVVSTVLVPVLIKHWGWNFALGSASALALGGASIWLFVRLDDSAIQPLGGTTKETAHTAPRLAGTDIG
jgi:MFS transporter, ACS family, glucarate transporter